MSNCIQVHSFTICTVNLFNAELRREAEVLIKNFVESPAPEYEGNDSWTSWYRTEHGDMWIDGNVLKFRLTGTTNREMKWYLREIKALFPNAVISFKYSDEYDGFRTIHKWR